MTSLPEPIPSPPSDLGPLREKLQVWLKSEIEQGDFPGAVVVVGDSSGILLEHAMGHSVVQPARIQMATGTIFDAASLTKPLITATVALRTAADGMIRLDEPVSKYLTELKGTEKSEITFIDLLTHRGGFQAWYPIYTQGTGSESYLRSLVRRPLRYQPGTREIYSCLGFITLCLTLERIHGRSIQELAASLIFEPLGLSCSMFNPAPEMKWKIAATDWGNTNERKMVVARDINFRFRDYMVWGETNDGNSWYRGGVAGNAGLFATAQDVFRIAQSYLLNRGDLVPKEFVDLSRRNYTLGMEENRGLGWQLPSSNAGGPTEMFSEHAFGHTGFTGTSVWVDPDRDLVLVLMSNRLHPVFKPLNMQQVRRKFHHIVVSEWDR